jgi:hypothetical protein
LVFNSTLNQWVPSNIATNPTGTNTYYGNNAGLSVTTGSSNVGIGHNALQSATTANLNVAVGVDTLSTVESAGGNIAIGQEALQFLTTGVENIAIGALSGSVYRTESGNIVLGTDPGEANETFAMRFGHGQSTTKTIIRGIRSYAVPAGTTLQIDSDDRVGVVPSSERYKDDIVDAKDYDDVVDRLKVVNFVYKEDPNSLKQVGLIAEQVFQVEPELVVLDEDNLPFTVNYIALVPILLQQVQQLKQQVKTLLMEK